MKKARKPETLKLLPTLAALEQEVVAEYRELGGQEQGRRLQRLAGSDRRAFSPWVSANAEACPAD